MPFDQNKWTNKKLLPYEEMLKTIRQHYGDRFEKLDANKFNLTSKPFKVRSYQGQVGFITSMTNNFCSSCNRLRITADGNLKVRFVFICFILSFFRCIFRRNQARLCCFKMLIDCFTNSVSHIALISRFACSTRMKFR